MSIWLRSLFLICTSITIGYSDLAAQVNSPYSRLGLGEQAILPFSAQRGMGMISSGVRSYNFINPVNPASYGGFYVEEFTPYLNIIRKDSMYTNPTTGRREKRFYRDSVWTDTLTYIYKSTIFATAVDGYSTTTADINGSTPAGDGGLSYLAMAFPVPKFGGISVGLMPFTTLSYDIAQSSAFDTLSLTQRYEGDGGIRQFYVGAAGTWKQLSVGLNARFLFGTLTTSSLAYFSDLPSSFGSRKVIRNTVGGMVLDAGLQYQANLNDKLQLILGGSVSLPANVSANTDSIIERVVFNSQGQYGLIEADTLVENAVNTLEMPLMWQAGFTLSQGNLWMLGADFRYEGWEGIPGFLSGQPQQNSWMVSAGGQVTPSAEGSFLERTHYRVGGYYGQSPVFMGGQPVNDFGITFGIGMPIIRPRQKLHSSVDLSCQVGRLGSIADNGIAENYFRFTMGFNLNDNNWIFKSKFY